MKFNRKKRAALLDRLDASIRGVTWPEHVASARRSAERAGRAFAEGFALGVASARKPRQVK